MKRSVRVPGLLALAAVVVPLAAAPGWAAGRSAAVHGAALRSADIAWHPAAARKLLCDPARAAEKSPQAYVRLFPGVTVKVAGGQRRPGPSGALDWAAQVTGDPDGTADFHFDALCVGSGAMTDADLASARVTAAISTGGHTYTLTSTSPGMARVAEVDPAVSEGTPGDPDDVAAPADDPATPTATPGSARTARAKGTPTKSGTARDRDDDSPDCHGAADVSTIDMAIFYTPEAADKAGGEEKVKDQARLGVDLTNRGFVDSNLPVRVRLVYTGPAAAEPGLPPVEKADLGAYRQWALDNDLWKKYSVDSIAVFQSIGVGVGYFVQNPRPSDAKRMFLLMNPAYVPNFTLGHELGHNLGLTHDWVADPDATDYPYAHGWIAPSKKWRTIMAYDSGCNGCARINRYSDAEATYQGEPLGAPDSAAQPSDSVRMIRKNAPALAAREPEKTPAVYCRLAVTSMPTAGGTATADVPGPYTRGNLVSATAAPSPNYRLTGWSLNGSPLTSAGENASVSVPIDADSTLQAHYAQINCALTLQPQPADGGTITADRPGPYPCGSTVTLTATPAPGWQFVGWNRTNSPQTRDGIPATPVYSATLDQDTAVTANFAPTPPAPNPPAPPTPPVPHLVIRPASHLRALTSGLPHSKRELAFTGMPVPLVETSLLAGLAVAFGGVLLKRARRRAGE
ncbi:hypothetical protein KGQ20_37190 [Catenulispora sp. NF23]|uniref:InlB B-repeat-containing protein n=1 Tax=Catenulispora pinistramenti TaxID=2705254 RepID=UPI001BAD8D79|nr:hypothetical protein [Catenulispora pinistramenti]MBS2538400.1 hypothetical protein [Catenulispora pinistramenti]